MSDTEVQAINHLRDDIRAQASALIDPSRRLLEREDGTRSHHEAPSLLAQLHDEIGCGQRPGGKSTRPGMPVAADVVDLIARIEVEVTDWVRRLGADRGPQVRDRVRAIVAAAGTSTNLDVLAELSAALIDWRRQAEAILYPTTRMRLDVPCPACEVHVLQRPEAGTGELQWDRTLVLDAETGCRCQACGAAWPVEQLQHLARVLGTLPETVAA